MKSECGLRQLLIALSLCSDLVTYYGVCCGGGGGYVCLCDVKSEYGLCQLLVAVTLCSGLSLSAGFVSYW